ncbi:transcription initiation factor IIB [Halobaculum sp. EA56]|uniref:transcription initiation factor IIB n=1 Tax=Halobaculum sp. EA56 TaxID=3421648 RepID=UPI003EBAD082
MDIERFDDRYDDEQGGQLRAETRCPECEGELRTEGGETTCEDCGLIIDEYRFDHGATPRSYDGSERVREQVGAPRTVTRHDYGLSTEIGRGTDARGNSLSHRKRRQLSRLRREHGRGRFESKANRYLASALGEIRRLTAVLELGQVVRTTASQLYREAQDADLIRGRSTEAMAAASVYAACRTSGYACSLAEIASVTHFSADQIRDRFRVLKREFDLAVPPRRPEEVLPRIASEYGLSDAIRVRAVHHLQRLEEAGLTINRKSSGVAAACIYVALEDCGEDPTKRAVAEVADISTITLNERIDELRSVVQ